MGNVRAASKKWDKCHVLFNAVQQLTACIRSFYMSSPRQSPNIFYFKSQLLKLYVPASIRTEASSDKSCWVMPFCRSISNLCYGDCFSTCSLERGHKTPHDLHSYIADSTPCAAECHTALRAILNDSLYVSFLIYKGPTSMPYMLPCTMQTSMIHPCYTGSPGWARLGFKTLCSS